MAMSDKRSPSLSALRRVCEETYGFWLDSALADGPLGETSFWGGDPFLLLRSRGTDIELWTAGGAHRFRGNPFGALRQPLREHRRAGSGAGAVGGAVGYLAYGMNRFVEELPHGPVDDLGLPECYLCFYERIAAFDPRPLAAAGSAVPRHSPLEGAAETPPSNFQPWAYQRAVERVRDYIFAGDVYPVNLSQRFQLPLAGSPFDASVRLRRDNPAPFAAYINLPEVQGVR